MHNAKTRQKRVGTISFTFLSAIIFYSLQSIKSEINPVLTPRSAGPEGSFIGVQGNSLSSLLPGFAVASVNYSNFSLHYFLTQTVFSAWFAKLNSDVILNRI